jgi:glycosyltransferase involved in cell wall biosynthesis
VHQVFPIASVIVPACNEERTIGRLLAALLEGARPGEVEIVVACNGCTDATAAVAAAAGADVVVVSIPEGSKPAALDLGDSTATAWPRFYVDADVRLDISAVRAVVAAMHRTDLPAAAPRLELDLSGRSWAVRAYYRTWLEGPYLRPGHIGSGVYVLSEQGRARFGAWPRIIADDLFVRNQFTAAERLTVALASFTQHPPYTLRSLIRIKTRIAAGEREYHTAHPPEAHDPEVVHQPRRWVPLLRQPRAWPRTAVYVGVTGLSRVLARRKERTVGYGVWERDETARASAGA